MKPEVFLLRLSENDPAKLYLPEVFHRQIPLEKGFYKQLALSILLQLIY